ncbi:hypothetical protein EYR38_006227 [Pleurotus pulmonarius]|nr:hypothetical protein EYR38_006227 [Pleurotus pulmonarius]
MTVKHSFCFNNATLCRAGSISIMDPQPVFFSDISDWNNVLASLARSFTCDYNIKVLICLSDYQGSGDKLWDEKYLPPVQYNQGFWVDWAGKVDAAWEQHMIPLYVVSTEDYDCLRGGPMAGTLKTLQNMWELLWDKGLRYVEEEVIKTRHTEHGPIRTFPSSLWKGAWDSSAQTSPLFTGGGNFIMSGHAGTGTTLCLNYFLVRRLAQGFPTFFYDGGLWFFDTNGAMAVDPGDFQIDTYPAREVWGLINCGTQMPPTLVESSFFLVFAGRPPNI